MELRKCSLCKEKLELSPKNFHRNKTEVGGLDYRCKPCKLSHYQNNKEKYKENSKNWQSNNPKKTKHIIKKYRQSEKGIANRKKYRKKEYDLKYNKDMEWTLYRTIRIRLHHALKNNFKSGKTLELLGCSIKEYLLYLESQFTKDMDWENYGIYWEIDHIKPLSKGGSFHYTNTQPLTVHANRSKSNKYEELSNLS